jgi:hypothetical protein
MRAIKDINQGDELSRVYGPKYWKDYEFWKKRPDCKWRETKLDEDLPNDYIFMEKIRPGKMFNRNYDLYGKKIDNKYYYKSYVHNWDADSNTTVKIKVDLSSPNNVMKATNEWVGSNDCGGYRDSYLVTIDDKFV